MLKDKEREEELKTNNNYQRMLQRRAHMDDIFKMQTKADERHADLIKTMKYKNPEQVL